MTTQKCNHCGKDITTNAEHCFSCRIKIKVKKIIKITVIILILLIISLIALVKCQLNREEATRTEQYNQLTPEQKMAIQQQQLAEDERKARNTVAHEAAKIKQQAEDNKKWAEQKAKDEAAKQQNDLIARQQTDQKRCADTSMAYTMSQKFVKRHLKSPTTAKFPWSSDSQVKQQYVGDCKHRVLAYVDSQNSFGATLRTYYYIELQYIRGSAGIGSWRELYFEER